MFYQVIVFCDKGCFIEEALRERVKLYIKPFGLRFGAAFSWAVNPVDFKVDQLVATTIVYLGKGSSPGALQLLSAKVPILPIVRHLDDVKLRIPPDLARLNCIAANSIEELESAAAAVLETLSLMTHQRRVFLSYKRSESRNAAVQLADALSHNRFDVFLDTRGVPPAVDFQDTLWHKLCECDVLLMLDTPNYFESRWTDEEFGRALSKKIPVLRVTWPDSTPDRRTDTAARVELMESEIDEFGRLAEGAVFRVASSLERLRAQSHAIRNANLVSRVKAGAKRVGAFVHGQSSKGSIYLEFADGRTFRVFPNVGVPTSDFLHDSLTSEGGKPSAIVYDDIGVLRKWVAHLDWLSEHIPDVRILRSSDVKKQLGTW